jgi:diadenosine tetraphosphate (Ap4A) HIT family hydrolase
MNGECPFCQPNNFIRPHFEEYGLRRNIDKALLFETDGLVVMTDILPVSERGHLLIVSKEHGYSLRSTIGIENELGSLLNRIETHFDGAAVFCEHGGSATSNGEIQSVLHTHGHLIFVKPEGRLMDYFSDELNRLDVPFSRLEGLDQSPVVNLKRLGELEAGYFFVQFGREGLFASDAGEVFPSQTAQTAMSGLLNNGKILNWKEMFGREEFERLSCQRVTSIVGQCEAK